ncbi:esterase-like activity of phytase family protein [uncultured Croceicoccus sp.]|uniref:esterase-like activity of phytase family protein n=1 Tax=uncultured Croceicoccus sp. TaxID=1295329 RepID=UPI00261385F9|nr:esterase-like activity of phytase family protein [uncultured Croceicoccus sp.]
MSAAARLGRIGGAAVLALCALATLGAHETRPVDAGPLAITAVPVAGAGMQIGPFTLGGAWRLDGSRPDFHGLSGLAILPDGRFLAVSDRGWRVSFPKPGDAGGVTIDSARIPSFGPHALNDLEGVAVDPDTGTFWITFEHLNAIARFAAGAETGKAVQPAAMASWPRNTGPETIIRLRDGRFIVIGEAVSPGRSRSHIGVLFDGDPVGDGVRRPAEQPRAEQASGAQGRIFHLAMPNGFRPVDGAQLPDGRVLILGRKFSVLTGFSTSIAIADPAKIRWGGLWQAREMARIDSGPLADNYEGLAIEPARDGGVHIWLVSDDNLASIIQHQYLLRLDWPAP